MLSRPNNAINIVSKNEFELGGWNAPPPVKLDGKADPAELPERAATEAEEVVAIDKDDEAWPEDDSLEVEGDRVEVGPAVAVLLRDAASEVVELEVEELDEELELEEDSAEVVVVLAWVSTAAWAT